jgi:hypothetical protein
VKRLVMATMALALLAGVVAGSGGSNAAGLNSITSPDTANVGLYTSLALDSSGNPVVSYYDLGNRDLKLLHCNDPNCAGGDESITSPDTIGDVGLFTSLVLDSTGNPVVSYLDQTNGDLKVLHCNDPNCAGNDESITSPDGPGWVGAYSSLALDGSGNPVVSYFDDGTNNDLKLLHCNDPNCAGGDESITSPDTTGDVGQWNSLALDNGGNPVVSYFDAGTNSDLKVLHCNDPNCAGDDESITSPDTADEPGRSTSLVLDGSGNPVVSYLEQIYDDLTVLHCNDPNCAGGDDNITAPGVGLPAWGDTSLALDSSGNPVVSYFDAGNGDLVVLRCDDPNCAGGGESNVFLDTPGEAGEYSSLALDAAGHPVVSYFLAFNDAQVSDLRLLHCGNPNCAAGVGGIAELPAADAASLEAQDSSGGNAGVVAGVVAALTAAAVALATAGWYARRRRVR